ncbi:putative reverse transcriptase domain-containing protein [Tanacetum coccineum]
MAQDNGYTFVEVQEDGTKTICINCCFEAQPGHGMSFATRLKPDREAMWVHCQMHHSRMSHTITNKGMATTGTTANTAYGFFLGKRVAYPVVANYVRNTWGKYGLVRSMFSLSTELFSFHFSFMVGLDAMLENGPWFIRNNPLILRKWHPDEKLLKEDVSTIPVWVKLHGVPVTAFSEDDLSIIATKLGTPLMLDSYTADMCMQS